MKVLILSFFLVVSSHTAFAGGDDKAVRKAAEAAIKHFKIDKMAKRLEKKYLDEDISTYSRYVWIVTNMIVQQRVTYGWTF